MLVEGQTEERFVKELLFQRFLSSGTLIQPVILSTKRTKMGVKYKGGVSHYAKIRSDVVKLLGDTSATAVTTFLDYYGLPEDFPGKSEIIPGNCYAKTEHLENRFGDNISHRKFIPFLMLHEFETMLFADIDKTAEAFNNRDRCIDELRRITGQFSNIEEINEGRNTHPSIRIKNIFFDYQKAMHGPLITGRIGLENICAACGHFKGWVDRLLLSTT